MVAKRVHSKCRELEHGDKPGQRRTHLLGRTFYNAPRNDFQAKLVFKPLSPDRRWKFVYEPIHQDVRILSKKISVAKFLNLQVGVGHNFQLNAINWQWKLTTCLGGDGVSRIRNKTTLGLCPGVDFRFGWRADYVLPEVTGGLGTDKPLFNMNSGQLQASLDRVEAILNYPDCRRDKGEESESKSICDSEYHE
ncbi:hypothetical protein EUGRSUZ_H02780 [Eucalyptus grandis]|uniref:Uncharacterized protein n=2 Tax=Eucalyptus grandis TaxID=71139 RepID=A0ACC3JS00_EUCGR|nr:hypothetical protein EUGRSUZ_H02780 [Eucalyptus grandis]